MLYVLQARHSPWRRKIHRHRYKTCDSMYEVTFLLHQQGQTATALDLLAGLTRIAGALEAGEGQMAWAEWKAGQILEAMGKCDDSRTHLEKAITLREAFRPTTKDEVGSTYAWDRLTPRPRTCFGDNRNELLLPPEL